jgi:hypothetical protein
MRALDVRRIMRLLGPVMCILGLVLLAIALRLGVTGTAGIAALAKWRGRHSLIQGARVMLEDPAGTTIQALPTIETETEAPRGWRPDSPRTFTPRATCGPQRRPDGF